MPTTSSAPEQVDINDHRKQHNEFEKGFAAGNKRVYRVANQTPLDSLRRRGSIDEPQFQAGVEMAKFFHVAGIMRMSRSKFEYQSPSTDTRLTGSEAQSYARERLKQCITAMGRVGSVIALDVCCYEYTVKDCSKQKGFDEKYAMERLREALDDYAVALGLKRPDDLSFGRPPKKGG